jgi:predicted nucleic acid-binding protein
VEVNLAARIPDNATVLLDTNPIIYLLEGHPLASRFEPIFADLQAGRISALVTPVTLAEVVSGPLRARKEALAQRYRSALTTSPGWSFRPLDADIAMLAARLRLRHSLKLPDAIQLATAIHEGCHALVSHDRDFGRVREVLVLGY